ncbi:7443_t:CDS:2, partial [Gigaspora rosea]
SVLDGLVIPAKHTGRIGYYQQSTKQDYELHNEHIQSHQQSHTRGVHLAVDENFNYLIDRPTSIALRLCVRDIIFSCRYQPELPDPKDIALALIQKYTDRLGRIPSLPFEHQNVFDLYIDPDSSLSFGFEGNISQYFRDLESPTVAPTDLYHSITIFDSAPLLARPEDSLPPYSEIVTTSESSTSADTPSASLLYQYLSNLVLDIEDYTTTTLDAVEDNTSSSYYSPSEFPQLESNQPLDNSEALEPSEPSEPLDNLLRPGKQSKDQEMIEEIMEGTDTEGMITEEMTTEETNVEDLVPVAAIAFIGIPRETEEALEKILEKGADTQTLIIPDTSNSFSEPEHRTPSPEPDMTLVIVEQLRQQVETQNQLILQLQQRIDKLERVNQTFLHMIEQDAQAAQQRYTFLTQEPETVIALNNFLRIWKQDPASQNHLDISPQNIYLWSDQEPENAVDLNPLIGAPVEIDFDEFLQIETEVPPSAVEVTPAEVATELENNVSATNFTCLVDDLKQTPAPTVRTLTNPFIGGTWKDQANRILKFLS